MKREVTVPQASRSVSREAILSAAVQVTAQDGLEGASLGAIAREAGTSKPLILYHFGTRQQLLREMASRVLQRIHQIMYECTRTEDGVPLEESTIRAVFAPEHRTFYAALHGVKSLGSRDREVGAQLRRTFDLLAHTAARLIGNDPAATLPRAHALVIGIQGYVDLWLYSGDPDPIPYQRGAAILTRALLDAPDTDVAPVRPRRMAARGDGVAAHGSMGTGVGGSAPSRTLEPTGSHGEAGSAEGTS